MGSRRSIFWECLAKAAMLRVMMLGPPVNSVLESRDILWCWVTQYCPWCCWVQTWSHYILLHP